MARTKSTTKKSTAKKTTARGRKAAANVTHDKAKMAADIKTQTAEIKLLKGTTRRPPNNPDMPQNIHQDRRDNLRV